MKRVLLENAAILTGAAGPFFTDGALLIEGSKIAWVGDAAKLPESLPRPTERQDLGGRVVIPGLVNTHAHGGLSAQRGCCDDGDLFEWAGALAPHTSHLTVSDNRQSCRLAILEMVRNGITTACDCTRYGAGVFADEAAAIGMRSLSGALANSPEYRRTGRPNWPLARIETEEAMTRHAGDARVRFYLGAHSPYSCTPELVTEVKRAADALGLPFVIHLAENRRETEITMERYGVSPTQWLHDLGALDAGAILAHCVWISERDLDVLAGSGAGVAHNPTSNAKLASGVAPVPAFLERGIPVGLGTDSSLSNNALDLFQEMKLSVLLQRATRLDGFAMNAEQAFAMATSGGARVLGWGADIGTLAPGMEADLVVLDLHHPLGLTQDRVVSDLVYHARPSQVRAVIVAGDPIYENGRFARVDSEALLAEARAHFSLSERNQP
ncbi:amidohydrolase (plasmid) [Salipiger sp. H15]|uniref:Amidohydrolase n=1 Tax=Alloyangia sp. H15 TaxID=3029062 RepID=A0AAU8AQJ3_9RHOB